MWQGAGMAMKADDYALSMGISPRGKIDSEDLRQLMVNRLTKTQKAALRRSLRGPDRKTGEPFGLYCEPCRSWWKRKDVPEIAVCGKCGRRYRVELVVYEEIEE